jgi:CRP-like cAMP-binding protein
MSKATVQRISQLELFGGCRRSQLERIDQLGVTLVVAPDRVLCAEGAPGAEFFVLVDGVAEVRKSAAPLAQLHPGAWFGEVALIDDAPRRATVTTKTDSLLLVYGRREFRSVLALAPSVRTRLQRSAALVIHGAQPTRLPWYQPVPSRPIPNHFPLVGAN